MSAIEDTRAIPEGTGPVAIRSLAYADLPGVLSIERRAFVTPWSMAMFVLELSKPSGICLAAQDETGLRGYLVCSHYADMWHLMNVAVDPDRRRERIATTLINHLLTQTGTTRVMLEVRGSNTGAIAMYRRFGFEAVGHRRRYYQDNGEDALVMEKTRLILAVETSCDDTCAAVVHEGEILANVISSQAASHAAFGGVVPEVASRHHLELINPVVDAALAEAGVGLDDLDAIAVTRGPGLIGALLVGINSAKALAAARGLPMIEVNHLHGHVAANFLEPEPLDPPFLCLIASGGHTLLAAVTSRDRFEILGQTLDDAAGEALDKAARVLGLGYPGGPEIQRVSAEGDPEAFDFPVAMARDPRLDFSFSGLKTSLVYAARELGEDGIAARRADLAASFQAAVVGQLTAKLERALDAGDWPAVALGGGVAANTLLRGRVGEICERRALRLKLVPIELCTDNAAMIGAAAEHLVQAPHPEYLGWDARV